MMKSYQHELETFKCAWSEYALKLRDQSEGHLQNQFFNVWRWEGDMRRAMISKLWTDGIEETTSSQLMKEIETVSVQKQLDPINKVKLFEAVQEPSEPIKKFIFRLQMLAYECNFTTSSSSQNCTAANYGGNILFAMVRGLA
jgi:hypothetical protein